MLFLLFLGVLLPPVLAITILPGGTPKPYAGPLGPTNAFDFFQKCAPNEPEFLSAFINGSTKAPSAKLLMSDRADPYYDPEQFPGRVVLPSSNSFIRGAIQAWSEHLHLVISPDIVWLTILTQLTFYMRNNWDTVKSVYDYESRPPVSIAERPDWYLMMVSFYGAVVNRVREEWVYEWLAPHFSTTNDDTVMAAHLVMLGFEKTDFVYDSPVLCGLPSVTLQGEERDWVALVDKLEKFEKLGEEAVRYGERLMPVLKRFVQAFKEPEGKETKEFWNGMVKAEGAGQCGGKPFNIEGWITAFHYWDVDGKAYGREKGSYVLDGYAYPSLNIRTLPSGYAKGMFIIRNYGGSPRYRAYAISGVLGKRIDAGAPEEYVRLLEEKGLAGTYNETEHSTLRPLSSWALFGPEARDVPLGSWATERELKDLEGNLQAAANQTECVSS
ncbi:hypothetical protein OQA88_9997 [Cercophora sp. LCS_1]